MSAQAYFKNIREHIAEELQKSKVSIWLAVAWFTDPFLFNIICEKAKSGIKVRLILLDDEINDSDKSLDFESLELIGGEIVWARNEKKGTMHNKFCTIDSLCCITGSYNWTIQAASSNQENITIHHDQKLTKDFEDEFNRLYNQFNQTIDISTINKRLNVLKSILQDGDQEDIDNQYWKLKDLLKCNIANANQAKTDLIHISNRIGRVDPFILITEIDKFISTDFTINVEDFADLLIPFRKGEKWGFCNFSKEIIIPCNFFDAYAFVNDFARVEVEESGWGYIDKKERMLMPYLYDWAWDFDTTYGIARVQQNPEIYFIDKYGSKMENIVSINENIARIEYRTDFYEDFSLDYSIITYGFFDLKKYSEIGNRYNDSGDFYEGFAKVKNSEHYGFINSIGEVVIKCKYEEVLNFSEGFAGFMRNGKCGFVNKKGTEVIASLYDNITNFSEGLAAVNENDKWGFIDKSGLKVIACVYEDIEKFCEGFAAVQENGKWGFIDRLGNKIISIIYEEVDFFDKGLAKIKKDEKFGFVNHEGRILIPCKYDDLYYFTDGLARFCQDFKWGFIDKHGSVIINSKYEMAEAFSKGIAQVKENGKWGFIDVKGTEIISCKYEEVECFAGGLCRVRYNGQKWGYIDKNGTEYWED